MRKDKYTFVIAMLFLALFLSACSGSGSADTPASEDKSAVSSQSVQTGQSQQESSQQESSREELSREELSREELSREENSGDAGSTSDNPEGSEVGMTNEELKMLSEAEKKQSEFLEKNDFYNIKDTDRRRELALEIVNKLAEEGYYIKESIYVGDDMISYQHISGALGGISLTDFDPYMN